MNFSK